MSRKERNSGAAMVIVLCVMVVFLALSTTIILAGSVTLNTARNNFIYERGKVQAASLSELFAKDLTERNITNEDSSLLRYVRDEIVNGRWPVYTESPDNSALAVKTFTLDRDDSKHQIKVEMYWTSEKELSAPIAEDKLGEICLFVDVISTLNDTEYHVKREFKLKSSMESTSDSSYPYSWSWTAVGRSPDKK